MKKIISILLAVMLLTTVFTFVVSAAEKPTLTITADKTTVCPGQTIAVTVSIINNPGYLGYSVDLDAEHKGFTVVSSKPDSVTFNPDNATYNFASTAPVAADIELFTLTLEAVNDIGTDITFDFEEIQLWNIDVENVDVDLVPLSVTVGHFFTNYIPDENGTTKTAKCDNCDATDTLPYDAPAHQHEYKTKVIFADPPSCTEKGRVYSQKACAGCGVVAETTVKVIPATGHFDYDKNELCDDCGISLAPVHVHELVKVDAKAATCTENGNIDYWYCTGCDWVEVEGGVASNLKAVQTPAAHTLVKVDAKAATCTENGNIDYWYCSACDWVEVEGGVASNLKAVQTPAAHTLVKVDAKAATCTENGNIDYWYCSACDWVEVEGGVASNLKAVQTPAAHTLVKVDAKAATCTENGNIDYWYCSACDWVEVEGGVASNLKAVQTPAAHTLEYVAAVAPTATENGNIEYWYCTACDWMETTGGVATNRLSVILPATGEVINPPTGDNAIFYVVALAVIATLGVAVVSFKKREEN